ncbi:hypothetical protein BpHYR1_019281 [Brachionus plicatilis]|uniref:Uncharacterized protein n=1 Tax=Brachionus plicatilis TaxID=10195 RepID=A0A3M7PC32_BRAPC|nr:hypothetical protein BpHYR1_019281 [Brachionus plicatilis]
MFMTTKIKNHEVCHEVLDHLKIFVHQLDDFDQNLNQSVHLIVKDLIMKFVYNSIIKLNVLYPVI